MYGAHQFRSNGPSLNAANEGEEMDIPVSSPQCPVIFVVARWVCQVTECPNFNWWLTSSLETEKERHRHKVIPPPIEVLSTHQIEVSVRVQQCLRIIARSLIGVARLLSTIKQLLALSCRM